MINYDGKDYELKFNLKRIKLIEAVIGKSVTEALVGRGGMMLINDVEAFYAYGLKEAGSDVFVKPKEGAEIADGIIENESYTQSVLYIQEAMKKDAGFLFRLAK